MIKKLNRVDEKYVANQSSYYRTFICYRSRRNAPGKCPLWWPMHKKASESETIRRLFYFSELSYNSCCQGSVDCWSTRIGLGGCYAGKPKKERLSL